MSEREKKELMKAKKPLPPEPLRMKPERRVVPRVTRWEVKMSPPPEPVRTRAFITEAKKPLPPEPTRRGKPKEKKKE